MDRCIPDVKHLVRNELAHSERIFLWFQRGAIFLYLNRSKVTFYYVNSETGSCRAAFSLHMLCLDVNVHVSSLEKMSASMQSAHSGSAAERLFLIQTLKGLDIVASLDSRRKTRNSERL